MKRIEITVSDQIRNAAPDLAIAAIKCHVENSAPDAGLWQEIDNEAKQFADRYEMADIAKRPAIAATRQAYKLLGKDPNRYRPSAEALCRRIIARKELPGISTLVDVINLVSIRTGYSIGGFDADKIDGNLVLGVGMAGEEFEAIGRGMLNIEGLPVYRDNVGGIGTPTSDVERTSITLHTSHLLMIINGYSGLAGLKEAADYSVMLLKNYAAATDIVVAVGSDGVGV